MIIDKLILVVFAFRAQRSKYYSVTLASLTGNYANKSIVIQRSF